MIPAVGLILALCLSAARAEIKLPAILGDNMVLQSGKAVTLWGWANPGETIRAAISGPNKATAAAKADDHGRWQVSLPALQSGGPFEVTLTDAAGATKKLTNVLVGETWICSGQSNMEFAVARAKDSEPDIAAAKFPQIRLFTVKKNAIDQPQTDCVGQWVECSPETVPAFSAVGYFFGRMLHQELKVPVGLINTSWGGTPAEAWTSRQVLEAEPAMKPLLDRWAKQIADFPTVEAAYEKQLENWKDAVAKAKAEKKKKLPDRPRTLQNPKLSQNRPANLYNGMIAPLVPLAIRGAIWYQGESNQTRAWEYRTLFPLMIRNWRTVFAQGEFPFGLVQLAPFRYRNSDPTTCAELRESQCYTVKTLPNVGMAVTMDVGDRKDIHPKNKQEVGRRLALWALAKVYCMNKSLVYSGPTYESQAVEGNKIRVKFANVGGGLATRDGKAPSHFTIAGKEQFFYPAEAKIDGNTVVVSSPQVPQPLAVRYAFEDAAEPNLMNQEGLPASPFKTDTWRWLTETYELGGHGVEQLVAADPPALKPGERIAFLGDSITAGGVAPGGYVWLIEDALHRRVPDLKAEVIHAGISGHKVPDLQGRLERDVLSKKPTAVFIYIGINDVWHSLKGHGTPKDKYEAGLRDLIARIEKAGAVVVLATPSVIGEKTGGANPLDKMLDEYAATSRNVAAATKVQLCDLHQAFQTFLQQHNPENKDRGILTGDGVHLSAQGNALVASKAAESILAALKKRK